MFSFARSCSIEGPKFATSLKVIRVLDEQKPDRRIFNVFRNNLAWGVEKQRMSRFYLGLKRGTLQKSVYPLEGSMTIGRSGENDITLMDFDVSRSHARISFQGGTWIIEDLGSSNGIILGGKRKII